MTPTPWRSGASLALGTICIRPSAWFLHPVVIEGDAELVLAAWRSIENDRTHREMLRATIKAVSLNVANAERWKQTPKAPDDLLWVLKRTEKLADVRNDAIHALVSTRPA